MLVRGGEGRLGVVCPRSGMDWGDKKKCFGLVPHSLWVIYIDSMFFLKVNLSFTAVNTPSIILHSESAHISNCTLLTSNKIRNTLQVRLDR